MNRTKAIITGVAASALAGTALLLSVGGAFAQGAPPDLPSTFYGPVSGGPQAGHQVVAFVQATGGIARSCGTGVVLNDNGLKYTIDVFADDGGAYAGCGESGRPVRFYFPATKQFATQTGTWEEGLAPEVEANLAVGFSLSMGQTLDESSRLPGIAATR